MARFRTEAEAAAGIQHPNVVQVLVVGEHQGHPFLCMEFCGGGSLEQRLADRPLPPTEAARLTEQLAQAVQAAHARRVVHRDLKPANVLFADGDRPKVADFGLAKRLDAADGPTASGAVMGTPSYMAPEQAAGLLLKVGPATDIYALGAILYRTFVGRPPFRADTVTETLLRVMHQEPDRPRAADARIPRDLESVCLKCLAKRPQDRYASAADLAADLRRFLDGRPVVARPNGRLTRGWRRVRRNPSRAATGVLAAVSLALVVALVAVSVQQAGGRADSGAPVGVAQAFEQPPAGQYALLIGVNEYEDLEAIDKANNLEEADRDAVNLSTTLLDGGVPRVASLP